MQLDLSWSKQNASTDLPVELTVDGIAIVPWLETFSFRRQGARSPSLRSSPETCLKLATAHSLQEATLLRTTAKLLRMLRHSMLVPETRAGPKTPGPGLWNCSSSV